MHANKNFLFLQSIAGNSLKHHLNYNVVGYLSVNSHKVKWTVGDDEYFLSAIFESLKEGDKLLVLDEVLTNVPADYSMHLWMNAAYSCLKDYNKSQR